MQSMAKYKVSKFDFNCNVFMNFIQERQIEGTKFSIICVRVW